MGGACENPALEGGVGGGGGSDLAPNCCPGPAGGNNLFLGDGPPVRREAGGGGGRRAPIGCGGLACCDGAIPRLDGLPCGDGGGAALPICGCIILRFDGGGLEGGPGILPIWPICNHCFGRYITNYKKKTKRSKAYEWQKCSIMT